MIFVVGLGQGNHTRGVKATSKRESLKMCEKEEEEGANGG